VKIIQESLLINLENSYKLLNDVQQALNILSPDVSIPIVYVNDLSRALTPWSLWLTNSITTVLTGVTVRSALCTISTVRQQLGSVQALIEEMNRLIIIYANNNILTDETFPDIIAGISGTDKTALQNFYTKYIKPSSFDFVQCYTKLSQRDKIKFFNDLACEVNALMQILAPTAPVIPSTGLTSWIDSFIVSADDFDYSYNQVLSYNGAAIAATDPVNLTYGTLTKNPPPTFANNEVNSEDSRISYNSTLVNGLNTNASQSTMTVTRDADSGIGCRGTVDISVDILAPNASQPTAISIIANINGAGQVAYQLTNVPVDTVVVGGNTITAWEIVLPIPLTTGDITVEYNIQSILMNGAGNAQFAIYADLTTTCSKISTTLSTFDYINGNGGVVTVGKKSNWASLFGSISSWQDNTAGEIFSQHLSSIAPRLLYYISMMQTTMPGIATKYANQLGTTPVFPVLATPLTWFTTGVTPSVTYDEFWNSFRADQKLFEATIIADPTRIKISS
jgi:hypothetical protein